MSLFRALSLRESAKDHQRGLSRGARFLMVNWLKVNSLLTDKFLTAGGGWYLMEKCLG